jgi:hypothetical protein
MPSLACKAQFVTNIKSGGKIETRIFSLIDEGGFVRTDDERFRLDYCEVKLSRWLMRAIETDQVVTISHDYFRLRRPWSAACMRSPVSTAATPRSGKSG